MSITMPIFFFPPQFVCNVDSLHIKCRLPVHSLTHKSNTVITEITVYFLLCLGFLNQPDLKQARALSSSSIYLAWEGRPIRDHPGGFRFGIYLKNSLSSQFQMYTNLSGSTWKYSLEGLQANVRYTICVGTVDQFQKSECRKVATVTTPAQKGKLSKIEVQQGCKGGVITHPASELRVSALAWNPDWDLLKYLLE